MKQPLVLSPAGTPVIEITIGESGPSPWVMVQGRLTGLDKSSARPRELTIRNNAMGTLTAAILEDGSFEFPKVLPGTYDVTWRPDADQHTRQITARAGSDILVEFPVIRPPRSVSGAMNGLPALSGGQRVQIVLVNYRFPTRALDETLSAFIEAQALAGNASRMLGGAALAESDGSFSIGAVRPGEYQIAVQICEGATCSRKGDGPRVIVADEDIANLVVSFIDAAPAPQGNRGVNAPPPLR
jgi:hypothetical protein